MRKPLQSAEQMSRRNLLREAAFVAAASLAGGSLAVGGPEGSVQLWAKVAPQKFPWGWIRWLMNGQIDPQAEMTLGVVHLEPHQLNPFHVHPNSAEYVYILSGASEHLMGGRWVPLRAGDTLRIPKGVPHQARTKDQACESLVVYDTPARQMVLVAKRPQT